MDINGDCFLVPGPVRMGDECLQMFSVFSIQSTNLVYFGQLATINSRPDPRFQLI